MKTQGAIRFIAGYLLMQGAAGHEGAMQTMHWLIFLMGLILVAWAGAQRQGVTFITPHSKPVPAIVPDAHDAPRLRWPA